MSDDAPQLQTLLEAELDSLHALHTALENEHEALLGSQVELLETATQQKDAAVQTHRLQQEQRLTWMAALGLKADTGLADLVRECGDTPRNTELQSTLASLATECQESNRRNGGLIIRLQERARGALDILRRDEGGPDLYSLSGSKEHHSDSRSLGKA